MDSGFFKDVFQPFRPKFEMIPLALHEAEPGHHLQVSWWLLCYLNHKRQKIKDEGGEWRVRGEGEGEGDREEGRGRGEWDGEGEMRGRGRGNGEGKRGGERGETKGNKLFYHVSLSHTGSQFDWVGESCFKVGRCWLVPQTAFAMEQESQPAFRKEVEDRRYYEAPARFALHTAYMEVKQDLFVDFVWGPGIFLWDALWACFPFLSKGLLKNNKLLKIHDGFSTPICHSWGLGGDTLNMCSHW